MKLDINVNVWLASGADITGIKQSLALLLQQGAQIMATQAQTAQDIVAVTQQLQKIGNESAALLQKITDLEAALAGAGNSSPEVETAMAALKQQAQIVDDLVPDAAP